jgi:hypothetical protein
MMVETTTAALVKAQLASEWGRMMPVVSTTFAPGDLVAENPIPVPPPPTMTVVTVGGDPIRTALGGGLHVECEWFVEGIRHSGWFNASDLHIVQPKAPPGSQA